MSKDHNASRRNFLRTVGVGVAGATAATAGVWSLPAMAADGFPTGPISLIVPWSAGGGSDSAMRAYAQVAAKYLKEPVVVQNIPGAGGTIGPLHIAHSVKADGYTIGQIPEGVFRQPAMRKTAWDPGKDFSYISRVGGYQVAIVVRPDSPFTSIQDVIAYAKKNPGKISFGSTGVATANHLGLAEVGLQSGAQLVHVPFKGSAESLTALLGGHVDLVSSESAGELIDAGKLRAIATCGEARLARWPKVPTLKEQGFDVFSDSPYGLAGPAGMDPKVVAVLDKVTLQVCADPEFVAAMKKLDQTILYLSTEDYKKAVVREIEDSAKLMKALGLVEKT